MLSILDARPSAHRRDFAGTHRRVEPLHERRPAKPSLRFGGCEVRPALREILVDGRPRGLQPRPFALLLYLIEHRDRVVPSRELLEAVWAQRVVESSSLAVAINRIRSVLNDSAGEIIRTHHRVGYRFVARVDVEASLDG